MTYHGFQARHDAELAWYFHQSSSALGERSTLGGQLAALERGSADSEGRRVASRSSVEAEVWRVRSARVFAGADAIGEFDPSLDAQPTQPRDRQGDGYTPSDRDMRRFTEVSRALRRLSWAEVDALARWYVQGERWRDNESTRLVPVMVMTTAGRRILALRAKRRKGAKLGPDELKLDEQMAAELREDVTRTDTQRRALVTVSMMQAQSILAAARDRYADAREPFERVGVAA